MNIQETVKHLEVKNTGELKKQEEEIMFLEKLELQGEASAGVGWGCLESEKHTGIREAAGGEEGRNASAFPPSLSRASH